MRVHLAMQTQLKTLAGLSVCQVHTCIPVQPGGLFKNCGWHKLYRLTVPLL